MAQLRLTLESITPLLMYGAEQTEPELRSASVRGTLRYWLRAVLGGMYNNNARIYEEESKILGNTEQGSRISLRIQPIASETTISENLWVLPKETSKGFKS